MLTNGGPSDARLAGTIPSSLRLASGKWFCGSVKFELRVNANRSSCTAFEDQTLESRNTRFCCLPFLMTPKPGTAGGPCPRGPCPKGSRKDTSLKKYVAESRFALFKEWSSFV